MQQEAMSQDGRQEVFRRVWDRVMPEGREDCPIVLEEAPLPPAKKGTPAPPPAPSVSPRAEGAGCLGEDSAPYGAQIQDYISHELADWRAYQALARRAPGSAGRVLASIAADEHRHAKRLSTAYFLISGVRYWPAPGGAAGSPMPLPAALRARFLEEQKGAASYRQSAQQTGDSCLAQLFRELAEEEDAHAWLIRGVLERL